MTNALQIFIYIFNKFTDLIFNQLELVNGVYFGWVVISIIILGILINSILNIPSNIRFNKAQRKENEMETLLKHYKVHK